MDREQVRARDLWRCVRCGSASDLQVHHRRMRSQGGGDTFSNLITLCAACHRWVHAHPREARELGLLTGHGTEPATVAIRHHAWPAGPILLRDDSTVGLILEET